ncbi:hypothetical protein M9Y10_017438 [Tritrichomonas musculus]|uniref:Sox C-terminal domain-containing protein n=1 Tax=Tritrichomonas musculus TaxID=1915356 RepID=A0ABR2HV96_9EUKA
MFSERSPFDIPELRNQRIEKIIKEAVSTQNLTVTPNTIQTLNSIGNNPLDCAVVITQLLREFDEHGSHPKPVYKALLIMFSLLKTNNQNYIHVCRALVPEIQSILYLSFGDKRVLFRDQIHLMAAAIYDFLMYEAPLPDANSFGIESYGNRQFHRPAPPPEDNDPEPVVFLENAQLPVNPYANSNASLMEKQRQQQGSQGSMQSRSVPKDDDDDIPFQPISNPFKNGSNSGLQQPASPEQQFSLFQKQQQFQTQQPTSPPPYQMQQQQFQSQQYQQQQQPSLLDFDSPAQEYKLPPAKPVQQQYYSPPTQPAQPQSPPPEPAPVEERDASLSEQPETKLKLSTDLCSITKTQYDDAIDFA